MACGERDTLFYAVSTRSRIALLIAKPQSHPVAVIQVK